MKRFFFPLLLLFLHDHFAKGPHTLHFACCCMHVFVQRLHLKKHITDICCTAYASSLVDCLADSVTATLSVVDHTKQGTEQRNAFRLIMGNGMSHSLSLSLLPKQVKEKWRSLRAFTGFRFMCCAIAYLLSLTRLRRFLAAHTHNTTTTKNLVRNMIEPCLAAWSYSIYSFLF